MAQTKASAATSISSRTRSHRLQREPQFAQDPKSGTEIEMEEAAVASVGGPGPEAPAIEGSSATDSNDADFVYDCTCFYKYKAYHLFKYYDKR